MNRCLKFILNVVIGINLVSAQSKQPVDFVNPLIGTQKMGHTFPGACLPFGMVQLSPDTDTLPYQVNGKYNPDVYRYCAGYQYDDKSIVGFSHTHLSGTGHSDLGDFLIMPGTGEVHLNPGVAGKPGSGYRSSYSHNSEKASPGYYAVKLEDYQIKAELTASERVGFHRYTFPKSSNAHIVLDLTYGLYNYPGKNIWSVCRIENDTLITGYKQCEGWARTRVLYFAMVISKPIKAYGSNNPAKNEAYKGFWRKFDQSKNFPDLAGRELKVYFTFNTEADENVKIKFAVSPVSIEGALENLKNEIPHFDFDKTKQEAQEKWSRELNTIEIEANDEVKTNFYTAMYHAMIAPNKMMDHDGQYKGLDYRIHKAEGFTNYGTFSLWDTYRALHPLYNIIQPERNQSMVLSMLAHADQSALHMLPIWSHYGNDNWCMSGYHAVSVIADGIIKGAVKVDEKKALAACVLTAEKTNYEGIGDYMQLGYVPSESSPVSVSNTLEYAYDDWCIAQLALKVKDTLNYRKFMQRANNYKNVFDYKDGFVKARNKNGTFTNKFDVLSTNGQGLIEGNSWNYSFFVPHAPKEMVKIMGGEKKFSVKLDSLFEKYLPDHYFAETEDITREGIIGTYVHGNEPAHHVPYLYNYCGQAYKTQALVRKIMTVQYLAKPDGLGGNDDCGQMSAWYIFSALGFYPVAPASDQYQLGSPAIVSAQINLTSNKTLRIVTENQSDKNVYVKAVYLNGKKINDFILRHAQIMEGGELKFIMTDKHP